MLALVGATIGVLAGGKGGRVTGAVVGAGLGGVADVVMRYGVGFDTTRYTVVELLGFRELDDVLAARKADEGEGFRT